MSACPSPTRPAGEWLTFVHRGPYTHATEPDLEAAHATVRAWAAERDLRLMDCTEQYRIGPVEEPEYARWETEVAYLVDRQNRRGPTSFP